MICGNLLANYVYCIVLRMRDRPDGGGKGGPEVKLGQGARDGD
jgi:hypothetical protein